MKAKIYTKTGDQGLTSLVGGARVAKTNIRLEAYGTLDELNSVLGLIRSHLPASEFGAQTEAALQVIQNNLFNIGSHLACEDEKLQAQLPGLSEGASGALEKLMDTWEGELPPLHNFILPGGCVAAAFAHLARTVCRRAERACVRLTESAPIASDHLIYMNRLSDWFFLLARKCNQQAKKEDLPWRKG